MIFGDFLKMGKGEKKKSIAIVGILKGSCCNQAKYGAYIRIDTPDLTMNSPVSYVGYKLKENNYVGVRTLFWLEITLGYIVGAIAKWTGKSVPVSFIRFKKFTASTEILSAKINLDEFLTLFLLDGLKRTSHSKFICIGPI